jgi:hypothetical protein
VGTEYRYKVTAVASGRSVNSNTVTATPVAPEDTFRILQEDSGLIYTESGDVLRWEITL